ncbi:hypothetical protein [Fodinibius sp. Rm-B-1B1-1]|uniref:hypothetical protein n=1 Tax=Fodinibius alkaliphilus TaxID=3140241 RepID=UPI00315A2853
MNQLRTYIIRIVAIAAICIGFGLYSVQQVQVDHSSQAFASWLTTMAESTGDVTLQEELEDIKKSASDLDEFIKEASQVIQSSNRNFEFSFVDATASSHIYQLLLIEWSQFQTGNAMAGVPVPSITKTFSPIVVDQKASFDIPAISTALVRQFWKPVGLIADAQKFIPMAIRPMVEGIAIGAP